MRLRVSMLVRHSIDLKDWQETKSKYAVQMDLTRVWISAFAPSLDGAPITRPIILAQRKLLT